MKKYQVSYNALTHGSMDIEANSKQEAEDKVWDILYEHGIPAMTEVETDFLIDFSEEIK